MKGISLAYTPALDIISKRALWILLILCEAAIGLASVALPPLYLLILIVGTSYVIYSIARPYFSYVLLLFSLPFFAYSIMGAQETKGQVDIKFSDIAAILAIFCWLANSLIKKNLSFEKSPIFLPIFLLYAWMFFSLSWCYNLKAGSIDFTKKLISVAIFFLTINFVTDKKRLDTTFTLWTTLGLIYAFCGLVEVFHQGFGAAAARLTGHWGEPVRTSAYTAGPNRLGFILNLCMMVSIPQLITTKSFKHKIFLASSITIMMLILITTMSRGAWAGFAAGAVILSFYSRGCRKALFIGLIVAIVFFITISTTSFMDATYERFAGLVNPVITKDYYGKTSVWNAGIKMFQDSPIRGVGIGSFNLLSPSYGSTILTLPHDLYIYILAEFGLIGMSLFIFLIIVFLFEAIKTLKKLTSQGEKTILVGLSAGLFIYCVQGISISFGFREAEMWAFFGLAVATIKILGAQQSTTTTSPRSLKTSK